MSDLWRRVLTALVLIPLALAVVLLGSTALVAAVFAGVVSLAAWEWSALSGVRTASGRVAFAVVTVVLLFGLRELSGAASTISEGLLVAALLWWGCALGWVIAYARSPPAPAQDRLPAVRLAYLVCGWLVLVPAWHALIVLHAQEPNGPHLVLALFLIIWSADTGAYFAGRRWGRRRLAPTVSPGKTWAGLGGGCAAGAAVAVAFGGWLGTGRWPFWLAVGVATVLFSVLGDLLESLVKRRSGRKDSGGLLPGHGGVLDRIDSLTAGAPLFALVVRAAGS